MLRIIQKPAFCRMQRNAHFLHFTEDRFLRIDVTYTVKHPEEQNKKTEDI